MIHRLRGGQTADRGQHTKRITGQHDDVLGMPAKGRLRGIADIIQRVGTAHIRRQTIVVKIQLERLRIKDHILDHGMRHRRCGINLRFGLGVQTNGLGIATALEIERAALRPAVLVVADQGAGRVRRKGGFTRAGQAKENGGINRVSRGVIGRTMHWHDAFFG